MQRVRRGKLAIFFTNAKVAKGTKGSESNQTYRQKALRSGEKFFGVILQRVHRGGGIECKIN